MQYLSIISLLAAAATAQSQVPPTPPKASPIPDLPVIGFGTWHLQDNGTNVTEVIATAIQNGYRHIDCAYIYSNQKEIGKGIKEGLKRTGLQRSDLWITGKLWNSRHGSEETGLTETLRELDLEYLDLWLIHWPMGSMSFDHVKTWQGMEKLVRPEKGTRFIGISNFNPQQVEELLKVAKIKPKTHQIELHPYLQQSAYVEQHKKLGIPLTGYSPLGNTNPVYASFGTLEQPLLFNTVIKDIAKARNCTPAQVSIAWNLKRGVVVIPKAVQTEHQKENIATFEKCKLTDEDMTKIAGMNIKLRANIDPCKSMSYRCFDGLDMPKPR